MVKLSDYGFKEEKMEITRGQPPIPTGFPATKKREWLIFESVNQSMEEVYYWVLEHLRIDQSCIVEDKISDVFAASEHSAFFGVAQQRIGLQQDKVSQFLATIGKMVKELFQLVRELRILDERLSYYKDSYSGSKSALSAEVTLKGIWIDMVEQGAKNPASVYGMARDLQFVTLPDLFFSAPPMRKSDVDGHVMRLDFNRKVKEVLSRKLRTFIEWKEATYKELKTKRLFTVKYLKQHYDIIKMYMSWVKPYLRNLRRLGLSERHMNSPDLVGAFESSAIEVEFLAKKIAKEGSKVWGVIIAHFKYRTMPQMSFQREGYQRGPLHMGHAEFVLRAYAWTEEEITRYKEYRDAEDMEILGSIDASVKAAMEALGDELQKYLAEAEGKVYSPPTTAKRSAAEAAISAADPFLGIFRGFGDMFSALTSIRFSGDGKGKPTASSMYKEDSDRKTAYSSVERSAWLCYKNFKKAHRMLTW
ncbi:hypothetical protein JXB02_04920 [Candidatus Woesearchaeota archaeon]|nr:hypothetical protein [Candidatus Woesearchaeota archaeon]